MKMRTCKLTHFHMNGCAPGLALIERLRPTQRWNIPFRVRSGSDHVGFKVQLNELFGFVVRFFPFLCLFFSVDLMSVFRWFCFIDLGFIGTCHKWLIYLLNEKYVDSRSHASQF